MSTNQLILSGVPGVSLHTSGTKYAPALYGISVYRSTDVSYNARSLIPTSGTLSKLNVSLSGSPGSGKSYTFTLYKNGSATPLTVTISDSETTAADTSNTVSLSAGDTVCLKIDASGTPTARYAYWNTNWEPTTDGEFIYGGTSGNTYAFTGNCLSVGDSNPVTTEDYAKIVMPCSGTWKKLYALEQNAPGTQHFYVTAIKNESSQTLVADITGAGVYLGGDTTHSFSVSAGDLISFKVSYTDSWYDRCSWAAVFVSETTSQFILPFVGGAYSISSGTNYLTPYGSNPQQVSESSAYMPVLSGFAVKCVYSRLSAAPSSGKSYTFTLRQNVADTGLSVSISDTSTTGNATETVSLSNSGFVDTKIEGTASASSSYASISYLCDIDNISFSQESYGGIIFGGESYQNGINVNTETQSSSGGIVFGGSSYFSFSYVNYLKQVSSGGIVFGGACNQNIVFIQNYTQSSRGGIVFGGSQKHEVSQAMITNPYLWLTYKGSGSWPFTPCPNKPCYNESDEIMCVENPIWKINKPDFGAPKTTPIHDPHCGYWPKIYCGPPTITNINSCVEFNNSSDALSTDTETLLYLSYVKDDNIYLFYNNTFGGLVTASCGIYNKTDFSLISSTMYDTNIVESFCTSWGGNIQWSESLSRFIITGKDANNELIYVYEIDSLMNVTKKTFPGTAINIDGERHGPIISGPPMPTDSIPVPGWQSFWRPINSNSDSYLQSVIPDEEDIVSSSDDLYCGAVYYDGYYYIFPPTSQWHGLSSKCKRSTGQPVDWRGDFGDDAQYYYPYHTNPQVFNNKIYVSNIYISGGLLEIDPETFNARACVFPKRYSAYSREGCFIYLCGVPYWFGPIHVHPLSGLLDGVYKVNLNTMQIEGSWMISSSELVNLPYLPLSVTAENDSFIFVRGAYGWTILDPYSMQVVCQYEDDKDLRSSFGGSYQDGDVLYSFSDSPILTLNRYTCTIDYTINSNWRYL